MGFLKVSIITVLILLFTITSCKPQQKNKKITENFDDIEIDKKVTKYPDYLNKDYVLGKFDYKKNNDFYKVPKKLSSREIFIRKETLTAFTEMYEAAKKDSIYFKVISGTRNFTHQKGIWDRKWKKNAKLLPLEKAKKILEYSSMPTTSRHHWGTDIDINNLNSSYFKSGKGKKEYEWLLKYAHQFGFYQVYTSKENGRTGYNEEEWHWSYAPLSTLFLKYYNSNIKTQNISGFKGASLADEINIIKNYVNGINPELLNLNN